MIRILALLAFIACNGCLSFDGNTVETNNDMTCAPDIALTRGLFGDGAPCNGNNECEHSVCMPSMNAFGSGICFSVEWIGCVAITEPVVFVPICDKPLRPYVCGDYDATLTDACSVVGTGNDGELYYCCET